MKRVLFLFIFSACIANVFAQDIILLNQEDTTVRRSSCEIQFRKRGAGGNTSLEIKIKNYNYDGVVLLFNQKCTEKELKKRKINKDFPKIYFEKKYNGTKEINDSVDIEKSVLLKRGSALTPLPSVDIRLGKDKDIEIPLYFGTIKKKKIYLTKNDKLRFIVRIPEPKDTVYSNLLQAYEKLERNVKNAAPLCPNKAHKEPQKMKQYKNDKDSLITAINNNSTYVYGQNRDNYEKLLKDVQNIEIKEEDCGRHKVAATPAKPVHSCQYCNMSLDDIYNKIEDIFYGLRKGSINKTKAGEDADKYYKACMSCPNLNKLWKKGGNVKKNIDEDYQAIKTFKE